MSNHLKVVSLLERIRKIDKLCLAVEAVKDRQDEMLENGKD